MNSLTAASFDLIRAASEIQLLVYSPDGDPLATVILGRAEAQRLVSLPVAMGHAFRASRERDGIVFVEPVEWE